MPSRSLPSDPSGSPPRPRGWAPAVSAAVLDLVLPQDCAGCGGSGGPLCPLCAVRLPRSGSRARGAGALPGLPPVVAAGPYEGVLRAALLAHKDGATGLVRPLGAVLAGAVLAAAVPAGAVPAAAVPAGGRAARSAVDPLPAVLLVPAPSSARAVRERGHDHALRLARRAAHDLRRQGVSARALAALRQGRRVHDQGSLTAQARAANLRGAVTVRRAARRGLAAARRAGVAVVLVDDVCASGATLAECARALVQAGHEPATAAVVAATVLRSAPPAGPGARARTPVQGPAGVPVAGGVLLARPPLSPAPLPTRGPED